MFKLLRQPSIDPADLLTSQLYDEVAFYNAFLKDLSNCMNEAIIESPFLTNRRVVMLLPTLQKLKSRHVRVVINTRDPNEHDNYLRSEATQAMATLQHAGIHVIFTESHHRKLAILDRSILWEGSLNILSQNDSREMMRRVESTKLAWQMVHFTKLDALMN